MNYETNLCVQKAMRHWARVHTWSNRYAVTLTMKQCLVTPSSKGDHKIWLDNKIASRNFRHFMNLLNDDVHGRSARRKGNKIRVIPAWETSKNDRIHGHAILERPFGCTDEEFRQLLKEKWSKTDWAYHQLWIKEANSGWLNYMLKFRGKESVADAIDWENVHNPR
jgi:hypothetical protein